MGNRIRELREDRGWSQRDLADRLGRPVSEIAAIEVGHDEPGVATALPLAKAFDRPVEELFHEDETTSARETTAWQYHDRLATAFDETGVLDEMGRDGWELTGFGPFVLHFRRPEDPERRTPWRHRRVTEFGAERERGRLERDGWTYCGDWLNTFHYFKRAG